MKILEIKKPNFPEIKIIRYERFSDERGYFTETFRKSNLIPHLSNNFSILQINESYSKENVFRGLHLQYDPPMTKMVRVLEGEIIDFFLDLRPQSKTFGQINGYHLNDNKKEKIGEWIIIPYGFAHGVLFLKEGKIEYLCDASWNPKGELAVNIFDKKVSWSSADEIIKNIFEERKNKLIMSEKDKRGVSLEEAKKILLNLL